MQDEIMSKETGIQVAFERSSAIFMAFVCAISLLAGAGWLFNQPILASLRPEYIPILSGLEYGYSCFPA